MPDFIKKQLPWLNDASIADVDQEFQSTDEVMDTSLPWRKITFLCKSNDMLVVTYIKGGIGTNYKIAFIKYVNSKVVDVWVGTTFCSHLTSISAIKDCIKKNRNTEMGLNTNIVAY